MLGAFLLPELVQFLFDDNILTCAAQLFAALGTPFPVFILGILPPTEDLPGWASSVPGPVLAPK